MLARRVIFQLKGRAEERKAVAEGTKGGFLLTLNGLAASHANQEALGFNRAPQGIGGRGGTAWNGWKATNTRQRGGGEVKQSATVRHETTWNKHKAMH